MYEYMKKQRLEGLSVLAYGHKCLKGRRGRGGTGVVYLHSHVYSLVLRNCKCESGRSSRGATFCFCLSAYVNPCSVFWSNMCHIVATYLLYSFPKCFDPGFLLAGCHTGVVNLRHCYLYLLYKV